MFQLGNGVYENRVDRKFMEGKHSDSSEGCECSNGDIIQACWAGHLKPFLNALQHFIEEENDIEAFLAVQDDFGNNVLHIAAYRGQREMVKAILDAFPSKRSRSGRFINSSNNLGKSAIHLGCMKDDEVIVEMLLGSGADPMRRDINGLTPLHTVAQFNALKCCKVLLDNGVSPSIRAHSGVHPLMIACKENHRELALVLAKAGADICAKSTLFAEGVYQTPISEATSKGWGELLRQTGAVPDRPRPPYLSSSSDTDVRISWYEVLGRSAPVESYRLKIRKVDRLRNDLAWTVVDKVFKERTHTFGICKSDCSSYRRDPVPGDLEPNEVYEVRVSATSIVGESPFSASSELLFTAPVAPSTPVAPTTIERSHTSIKVMWVLPECNGLRIDRSELQYCLCHSNMSDWVSIPDALELSEVVSEDEVSSSESDTDEDEDRCRHVKSCEYTVTNLSPGHFYRFRVRVHNMLGWSHFSAPGEIAEALSDMSHFQRKVATNQRPKYEPNDHAKARYRQVLNLYESESKLKGMSLHSKSAKSLAHRYERRVGAIKLQSWIRSQLGSRSYRRFQREHERSRYFLVQYGTDEQFLNGWREKLLFHANVHRRLRKHRQKILDEKRQGKLARRQRRERRRRKRQVRVVRQRCEVDSS